MALQANIDSTLKPIFATCSEIYRSFISLLNFKISTFAIVRVIIISCPTMLMRFILLLFPFPAEIQRFLYELDEIPMTTALDSFLEIIDVVRNTTIDLR